MIQAPMRVWIGCLQLVLLLLLELSQTSPLLIQRCLTIALKTILGFRTSLHYHKAQVSQPEWHRRQP